MSLLTNLWKLYLPLVSWVGLGLWLGHRLPQAVPLHMGKFLFWVGVPLSILVFLRQADLTATIWLAPLIAWIAMLLGAGLAWLWIWLHNTRIKSTQSKSTQISRNEADLDANTQSLQHSASQGSFLLLSMVGNTGYLGYPVTLALVGAPYFGWAIFYDILGSALGSYGLGVVLAAYFGQEAAQPTDLLRALIRNPALWSFWLGLALRPVSLPLLVEQVLGGMAWAIVALSLLLLGMRLGQIRLGRNMRQALASLGIKMLLVPLALGYCLTGFGMGGAARLVMVLQMAMPPAFSTLIITEAYDLDRELTVTTLALGSVLLLVLLPLWLILFS